MAFALHRVPAASSARCMAPTSSCPVYHARCAGMRPTPTRGRAALPCWPLLSWPSCHFATCPGMAGRAASMWVALALRSGHNPSRCMCLLSFGSALLTAAVLRPCASSFPAPLFGSPLPLSPTSSSSGALGRKRKRKEARGNMQGRTTYSAEWVHTCRAGLGLGL